MPGRIDRFRDVYDWLSNFHWVGDTTVEHHYQAAKVLDPGWRAYILSAKMPAQAKARGTEAKHVGMVRPDWEQVNLGFMLALQRWKYSHEPFRSLLLATGDAEIIEGTTWHDTFYGVCTCRRHRGEGENRLGRMIMQVREELHEAVSCRGTKR